MPGCSDRAPPQCQQYGSVALDSDQVAIGLWCLTFAARGDVECSLPMCKTKHVAFMKQRAAIAKPTNVIHRAMCNHAQSKSSMIPCLTSIAKYS